MKAKSRAITQVSLALLLALSLGLMTVVPSLAQGSSDIVSFSRITLSPDEAEYYRNCGRDVRTTITYVYRVEIEYIRDDERGVPLEREKDYTVNVVEPGRSFALTIKNSYLENRLDKEGDSLELRIVFDDGSVRRFIITAVQYPAVYPATGEYNVLDPPEFVQTRIIQGCAGDIEAITDQHGYSLLHEWDYRVLGDRLLILKNYLKGYLERNLEAHGEAVTLLIQFAGGGEAGFVVKGIRVYPEVSSPSNPSATFDLSSPAPVRITITLYDATEVKFITDQDDEPIPAENYGVEYRGDEAEVTILQSYLESRLLEPGHSIALNIICVLSDGTPYAIKPFRITAVDRNPYVVPKTTAEYDIDNPDDVEFIITWGDALEEVLISDDHRDLIGRVSGDDSDDEEEYDYELGETVNGEALLTILESYLRGRLERPEAIVELTLVFIFDRHQDVAHLVPLVITATATRATIAPEWVPYDPQNPSHVSTVITWRDADERTLRVFDDDDQDLTGKVPWGDNGDENEYDYELGDTSDGKATLTILQSYLSGRLQNPGQSIELKLTFNVGLNATLLITAVRTPYIDPPPSAYYDGSHDVEICLVWQSPTKLDSITRDGRPLNPEVDYKVGETADDRAKLTIRDSYLRYRLPKPGQSIDLKLTFNVGRDADLTITAVRSPKVTPESVEYHLVDDYRRGDVISTQITRGSAGRISRITETDGGRMLTPKQDWLELGDTLFILYDYIEGIVNDKKLGAKGDRVDLNIQFDGREDDTAVFAIEAGGDAPKVCTPKLHYNLDKPDDVHTIITFNVARSVTRIEDGKRQLFENEHYALQSIEPEMSANLTVMRDYLANELEFFGQSVTLTIVFDVGPDRIFIVDTVSACFIATAAYGTPMAEEVQILRDLRDGHLLTNPPGRAFVGFYYRISPPIARFITEHDVLKPVVRAGLVPAVAISTMVVDSSFRQEGIIPGLVLLASVLVAVWANRRRKRNTGYA